MKRRKLIKLISSYIYDTLDEVYEWDEEKDGLLYAAIKIETALHIPSTYLQGDLLEHYSRTDLFITQFEKEVIGRILMSEKWLKPKRLGESQQVVEEDLSSSGLSSQINIEEIGEPYEELPKFERPDLPNGTLGIFNPNDARYGISAMEKYLGSDLNTEKEIEFDELGDNWE